MGTLQSWLRKSAGLRPSAMEVVVTSRHTRLHFALLPFAGGIAAVSQRPACASPRPSPAGSAAAGLSLPPAPPQGLFWSLWWEIHF